MAKESLDAAQIKEMLLQVADRIIESEPILTDADRALGDGDHGTGMKRGLTAVKEKLDGLDAPISKLFSSAGMAMISSMGGASGAIFGTVFRDGGKALADQESFDAASYATFLQAALEGVQKRGGAKPGDKTMVDALHPAAEKAQEVARESLSAAANAVADAGEAGKEASKDMIATMGRARTLGERSLGHPDAGAVSISIILATIRDYIDA